MYKINNMSWICRTYRELENYTKKRDSLVGNKTFDKDAPYELAKEMVEKLPSERLMKMKILFPAGKTFMYPFVFIEKLKNEVYLKKEDYRILFSENQFIQLSQKNFHVVLSIKEQLKIENKFNVYIIEDLLNIVKFFKNSKDIFNLPEGNKLRILFESLSMTLLSDFNKQTYGDLIYTIDEKFKELFMNSEYKEWLEKQREYTKSYVGISKLESKLTGEVFTDDELIRKIILLLPDELRKNPDIKILDPAAGTGNFSVELISWFMSGLEEWEPDEEKRYKHIVENMIYQVELVPKNAFINYQILDPKNEYKLKVYRGDFLCGNHKDWFTEKDLFYKHMKEVWKVDKFDVIIGNPPYLKGLWVKFMEKSLKILKSYGLLISPDGTKNNSKISYNLIKLLKNNGIQEMTECTNFFNVKSGKIVYYFFDKNKKYKEVYKDNSIDGKILNKVINKSDNKLNSILSNNRSKIFNSQIKSDIKTDKYDIPIIENVTNSGLIIKYVDSKDYRNKNLKVLDLSKWVITNRYFAKNKITPIYYLNEKMAIGSNVLLIKKPIDIDNFKIVYLSNIIRYVLNMLKNDMFDTSPRHINLLPLLDLSKSWTDEELYNYFNITEDEIKLIEKTIK